MPQLLPVSCNRLACRYYSPVNNLRAAKSCRQSKCTQFVLADGYIPPQEREGVDWDFWIEIHINDKEAHEHLRGT